MAKKAAKMTGAKKDAVKYRCMRCKKEYNSWRGLQTHSAVHLKRGSFAEIQQLKDGVIPETNKIGTEFKGKNRIIIS